MGFSEGDLYAFWQPVQGRLTSSQQPGTAGGTRIQGCGDKRTRGLYRRPLPGREGPENIPFLPCLAVEAAARSSWLPEVGSGPRTSLLCAAGSRGVGVLTRSTSVLGDWTSSAVLTAPGHPIWGSGPRTIFGCSHCLILSPVMGGPPCARG